MVGDGKIGVTEFPGCNNKFLEGVPTKDVPTTIESPGTTAPPNNGW